ncbi:MAG: tetratricopeptide repeat protein [Candidatus Zixiibacteriota bacterium]
MVTETKPDVTNPPKATPSPDQLLAKDLPRDAGPHKDKDRQNQPDRKSLAPVELAESPTRTSSSTTAPRTDTGKHKVPSAVTGPVTAPITTPASRPQTRPSAAQPVAHLMGRSLRFPAGTEIRPGQTIEAGGRVFEIKPEEIFRGPFLVKSAGLLVLTILAAIGIAYMFSGSVYPALMGVVINSQTGEVVPNATVTMVNGGSVRTNEAGLYVFRDIQPGQHVLTATAEGFGEQNGIIHTEGNQPADLSFAISPLVFAAAYTGESDSLASITGPEDQPAGKKPNGSAPAAGFGSVDLLVDFNDYIVFVDGELYGKNADKVKRLSEGDHRILLQVEGYQDFAANVSVKARVTSTLTVNKADLTPKIDPVKKSRAHFADGKNYLDRQEWAAAIFEFNKALEFETDYAEALQYRGWAYSKSGNPTKATEDFLKAAQIYDDSKRYIDAIACMRYLVEMDPKNAGYWRRRADFHLALADYNNAIADYEQALKNDKKSVELMMALGEAYFAGGDFKEAAKQFDRARKASDDPTKPYIRMIMAYYQAGANNEVIKKYREFTQIAPQELQDRLRNDPEWLRVLQIVGPDERTKN